VRTAPDLLLAIDASGSPAGAALYDGDRLEVAVLPGKPPRTEDLTGIVAGLLARLGRRVEDVTVLGVVVGPGSYTGLRSSLAFVRGLAFPGNLPVVGVGTLELLAFRGAAAASTVVAVAPAHDRRRYASAWRREGDMVLEVEPVRILEAGDLDEFVASVARRAGRTSVDVVQLEAPDGWAPKESDPNPMRFIDPHGIVDLATLAWTKGQRGLGVPADEVLPLYVGPVAARPNDQRIGPVTAGE